MKSLSEHAVNIRTSDYNTLNYKKIEDDYKTSIRKERVKSHSEVLIANFLFTNGINDLKYLLELTGSQTDFGVPFINQSFMDRSVD